MFNLLNIYLWDILVFNLLYIYLWDILVFNLLYTVYLWDILEDEGVEVVGDTEVVGGIVPTPTRAPQQEAKTTTTKSTFRPSKSTVRVYSGLSSKYS